MKLSYDSENDALYIYLHSSSAKQAVGTVELTEGVVVDIDENGLPLGIDIHQNASSVVDLSRLETEGLDLGFLPHRTGAKAS